MPITENTAPTTVYVSCRAEAEQAILSTARCVLVLSYANAHLDTLELSIMGKSRGICVQADAEAAIG